ncbi:MAG: STAS domain-containing protein [Planctomycetota bacterium]
MQIDESSQAAVTILAPKGAVVGTDASGLAERFRAAASSASGRVVIDLAHVSFVDSLGLETLADLGDEMSTLARTLKLAAANQTLREVLDLTGVGGMCELYDDVSAAVRSYG